MSRTAPRTLTAAALAAVTILAGCGSEDTPHAERSPAATTQASVPKPKPSPTPATPAKAGPGDPLTFLYSCGDLLTTDVVEAQAKGGCREAQAWGGTISAEQQAILDFLGPAGLLEDEERLVSLYSHCAYEDFENGYYGPKVDHAASNWEAAKALTMACTEHPMIAALTAEVDRVAELPHIKNEREDKVRKENGQLIEAGSYLVGTEIPAGVWQTVSEKVSDCYWEISDAQGNTIENNFISVSPQLDVTVPESAAGFTTSGCGKWRWLR